jgi:hypothetical protein
MKMKESGEGEIPAGVLVISFSVRKKETEAYVNNVAVRTKGLYIIDHKIRGESSESGT